MNHLKLLLFPTIFLFSGISQAQTAYQLMNAESFHQHLSPEQKVKTIREFEISGWISADTFINLDGHTEIKRYEMAPYVNDMGEAVYLVTEKSPEFPGGYAALKDYFQNELQDLLAKDSESPSYSVYYQFVINTKGKVVSIAPTQPLPDWVPAEVGQRIIKALENMPDWTPGQYRGRPVNTVLPAFFNMK